MTDLYCVIGRPIAHSRSPQIYNAAFRELGMDAVYIRLASRSVEEAVAAVRGMGIKRFNVTSPYKGDIIEFIDWVELRAAMDIDAVNTVVLTDDGYTGFNTDGYGAVRALEDAGADLKKHRFLVLGAGGAARAVGRELADRGAQLAVANRDVDKARDLARELGCGFMGLQGPEFVEAVGKADVIVSCLPTLERVVPAEALRPGHIVLDGNYRKRSALVDDAERAGAVVVDGLEWLVHQAVRAFRHYTDADGPEDAMRDAAYAFERPYKNHNIALIGPMGSGKTETAKALAGMTGHTLADTDAEIASRLGKGIPEIFREHGENTFREHEKRVVEEVMLGRRQVVALGGGVVLDPENVGRIRRSAFTVLLWAPAEVLAGRLAGAGDRPLLQGAPDPAAALAEVMRVRFRAYMETADIVIDTSALTIDEVAELIKDEVHQAFGD